jgi:hypothetical protein
MNTLNTDDIFLRNLTISLLDLLNSEMHLTISRADHKETFSVPFLYNFATTKKMKQQTVLIMLKIHTK